MASLPPIFLDFPPSCLKKKGIEYDLSPVIKPHKELVFSRKHNVISKNARPQVDLSGVEKSDIPMF